MGASVSELGGREGAGPTGPVTFIYMSALV